MLEKATPPRRPKSPKLRQSVAHAEANAEIVTRVVVWGAGALVVGLGALAVYYVEEGERRERHATELRLDKAAQEDGFMGVSLKGYPGRTINGHISLKLEVVPSCSVKDVTITEDDKGITQYSAVNTDNYIINFTDFHDPDLKALIGNNFCHPEAQIVVPKD